jgi:hypothetical protein
MSKTRGLSESPGRDMLEDPGLFLPPNAPVSAELVILALDGSPSIDDEGTTVEGGRTLTKRQEITGAINRFLPRLQNSSRSADLYLAVLTFDASAQISQIAGTDYVHVPDVPTPLTIDWIKDASATNLHAALDCARTLAKRFLDDRSLPIKDRGDKACTICLLTDGMHNCTRYEPRKVAQALKKDAAIRIATVLYGSDKSGQELLLELCSPADGRIVTGDGVTDPSRLYAAAPGPEVFKNFLESVTRTRA